MGYVSFREGNSYQKKLPTKQQSIALPKKQAKDLIRATNLVQDVLDELEAYWVSWLWLGWKGWKLVDG